MAQRDLQPVTFDTMAAIATVEIDAPDILASQSGHLIDLPGQGVPVVRIARQRPPITNCPPLQRSLVVAMEALTPNS